MSDSSQKQALRTIFIQVGVTLFLALAGAAFFSFQIGYSILLGGVATVIPALIFALLAFAHNGARQALTILRDFYLGELLKFASMAILFAIILLCVPVDGIAFISGFIITQLLSIFAPWLLALRRARVEEAA